MKVNSKLLSLVLTLVLVTSSLFGCNAPSKEPTAEELMSNLYGTEKMESGDANAILDYDFKVATAVDGTDVSMDVNMAVDLNLQFDNDASYITGDMSCDIMGMSVSEDMEMYVSRNEDSSTLYTLTNGVWEVEENADNSKVGIVDLAALGNLSFNNLTLEKGESTYTVTGSINYKDISKALNMDLSNPLGDNSLTVNLDNLVYNMTADFDVETRTLSKMILSIEDFEMEKVSIDKMLLTFTINKINGVDVTIPEEVKNASESTPAEDDTEAANISGNIEDDITDATLDFMDDVDIENSEDVDVNAESTTEATDDTVTETPSGSYSDFSSGTFSLNGKSFTLNKTTVGELLSNVPYVVTDSEIDMSKDNPVNPSESITLALGITEDDYDTMLFAGACNYTDAVIDLKDCVVYGISYDAFSNLLNGTPIADLTVAGISTNKVIDVTTVLGEPDATYNVEQYTIYEYVNINDGADVATTLNIKVDSDGKVMSLDFNE